MGNVTEWGVEKTKVVAIASVLAVMAVCFTIGGAVASNNSRSLEERRLQEVTRRQQAVEDLEAKKVQAEVSVREAEIKSKKRKIWERDSEGVKPDAFAPMKEGF